MKVCPSCHSRFVGGETFCPHDGSKLVEARELSPGEMTGTKLDDVVRLDRLVYSDGLGERYAGRLLEGRRAVFVSVFNQALEADGAAQPRVETARAKVGTPLPPQINTLLQLHLDKNPPYIIEPEPRGPSVRELLVERRHLSWQEAVRITAHLGRVAQWLADNGVALHTVHPEAIYVTKLAAGEIQVGDWAFGALLGDAAAADVLEKSPDAFAGYVDYLAPEVIEAPQKADVRSSVYALGCLLYEMILGKPPLPAETAAETCKRHRHEKPIPLAIARGGGEFPSDLDDLLEMMLAKEPERRFQTADAVVAALSNLLDVSPDELAAPIERASEADEDDLYRTIDMDSVDRAALLQGVVAKEEPSKSAEDEEAPKASEPVSGTSETTDEASSPEADGAEESEAAESDESEVSVSSEAEESEGSEASEVADDEEEIRETGPRKTLLFGDIGGSVSATALGKPASGNDPRRETSNLSRKQKKKRGKRNKSRSTVLTGPNPEVSSLSEESAAEFGSMKQGVGEGQVGSSTDQLGSNKVAASTGSANDFSRAASESGVTKRKTIGKVRDSGHGITAVSAEASPDDAQSLSRSDVSSELGVAESESTAKNGVESSAAAATSEPEAAPEALFSAEREATGELDRSEWFNNASEADWDASLADEHHQQTEKRFKFIAVGVFALLCVLALGYLLYVEVLYTPEEVAEGATNQAAVAEAPEPAAKAYDAAPVKIAFDEALEGGRLVAPLSNSAVKYLGDLKRYAPESAEYETARKAFVAAARDAAVAADEAGNLADARALAGYASQYAPEDEALAKMTADLQARFTGQTPDALDSEDTPEATEEEEPVEEPEVAIAKPQAEPKPAQKKSQKNKKKSQQKSTKKNGTDDLVRDARVALGRGDTNEARLLYHKALAASPKASEIHAGLGKVYFEQSNYREAVKYQQKAVRYAPGRLDYRIALGQSFYRLGKYQEAIGVWENVLKKDPDNRFARQYIELAKKKL